MKNKFTNDKGNCSHHSHIDCRHLSGCGHRTEQIVNAHEIYDATNISDGIKLTYIAKSGFYGAVALLSNSKNDYETLRDDWAKAELLSQQSASLFPDGCFITTIEDEAGKIPLNKLVNGNEYNSDIKEILIRLLSEPELGLDENKTARKLSIPSKTSD